MKNTRAGKQLSKSSILLVHGVVEALLLRGQMQEKDLKEYLVAKFKKLGLKVSSRSVFGGTFDSPDPFPPPAVVVGWRHSLVLNGFSVLAGGAGTSLEVSSVCNILAALGILETVNDADAAAATAPTPRHDEELHKLNEYLRVKFENTPFEPSNRSETFVDPSAEGGATDELTAAQLLGHEGDDASGHHHASLHPTDDLLDPEVVNLLMANTSPLTTGPEPEMADNVHASLLDEGVSDDFLAALPPDVVGRTFDFPAASTATATATATANANAAEKKSAAEASTSEAQPVQPPTPSSSQTPRRQYQAGRKFWALRDGRLLPHHMLAMVSNPAPVFLRWMQTCHTYASALEIEEKMLRRLCSDIDVALPPNTLREGTKYVQHASVRPPLPSAAPFRSESTPQRRAAESQAEPGDAVAGTRDLLDGRKPLTGDMLIDKIFKSKRQRSKATSSASNGAATFSASHLQSLRSVCQKTEAFLKAYAVDESGGEENGKHRKPKAVAAESISFAEYVRSMHMQNAQVTPNAILGGLASASNVLVAGAQPVITAASVRRNAQPHQLSLTTPEFSLDADGVKSLQYPIQLPDLAVSTIEVPWRSLVTEFSLVVLDDAGEFVDGLSNTLLSHAEQSVEQSASSSSTTAAAAAAAAAETATATERGGASAGKPSSKKRSRSSSQLAHEESQPDQVSVHHALKRKIISEVLAPGVRLSTTKASATGPVAAGDGDDDEDTSDGHYLERHDAVLKTMRERWALLNKLKHEVRRDQTTPGSAMKRQRHDSEQLSIPGVPEESEPAAHEQPAVSLTPLIKKRGRPPKFHKSFSASSKSMGHDAS